MDCKLAGLALPLMLLAACGSPEPETTTAAVPPAASSAEPAPLPAGFPPEPGQPNALPADQVYTASAPADPRSAEGAAEVVRTYFDLIEQKKFDEARMLVGPKPPELKLFIRKMAFYPLYRARVGKPGRMEGAAGSSYVEVPIQTYGRDAQGQLFSRLETVQLKRVNDVPGATPEQLRWRIYQITLQQPAGAGA
jgi:hypothetical protein